MKASTPPRLSRRSLLGTLGILGAGLYVGSRRNEADAAAKPRLFAFVPALDRTRALKDMLVEAFPKLEVTAFGRFADFAAATAKEKPEGALAPVESLQVIGLTPHLRGIAAGSPVEPFVILSKEKSFSIAERGRASIGVVDVVGRNALPSLVQRMLSLPSAPLVKRVLKVSDLLPLLHLDLAPAVLLPERFEAEFRSMSRLELRVLRPPAARLGRVALSYTGAKVSLIGDSFQSAPSLVKAALGVEAFQ